MEASDVTSLCLFGKVMMSKSIYIDATKGVLSRAWQVRSGLEVIDIGNRIFLFQFFDVKDKARAWFR